MGDQVKRMRLRYGGACGLCGVPVPAGTTAGWDRSDRRVVCPHCLDFAEAMPEVDPGTPGGSLEREYGRRRQGREDRMKERFPRAGGLLARVTPEPQSTRAFAQGASGEQALAARLQRLCGDDVLFLHNRRLGAGRRDGDVDHVAVTPSGVYVIDAKKYAGAKVVIRRSGGLFTPRREALTVRGRDRSSWFASLNRQCVAVSSVLDGTSVPVTAVLCMLDAELPLLERLVVDGVPVLGPRGTGKLLRRPGPLGPDQRQWVWERLGRALPSA